MTDDTNIDSILTAVSFAARAHLGQQRKDRRTPYAAHPMRVMTILALVFRVDDPTLLATGLLHDTIEDTPTDFDDLADQFGAEVAENVALLTKDMRLQEEARERDYFDALANAPVGVQLCKLADAYDNLVDSPALPATGRSKAVQKAIHLIELVGDQVNEDWHHAVRAVQQRVEEVRATL